MKKLLFSFIVVVSFLALPVQAQTPPSEWTIHGNGWFLQTPGPIHTNTLSGAGPMSEQLVLFRYWMTDENGQNINDEENFVTSPWFTVKTPIKELDVAKNPYYSERGYVFKIVITERETSEDITIWVSTDDGESDWMWYNIYLDLSQFVGKEIKMTFDYSGTGDDGDMIAINWNKLIEDGFFDDITPPDPPDPPIIITGDAPIVTLSSYSDIYIYVGDTYVIPNATAVDKDGNPLPVIIINTTDVDWPNVYQVFYWAIDADGRSGVVIINVYVQQRVTDVGDEEVLPTNLILHQNYPQPFNPSTTIRYELPENDFVSLSVYDILGRKIATLVEKEMSAGIHEVQFNAAKLSSGTYIYTLQTSNGFLSNKMQLLK